MRTICRRRGPPYTYIRLTMNKGICMVFPNHIWPYHISIIDQVTTVHSLIQSYSYAIICMQNRFNKDKVRNIPSYTIHITLYYCKYYIGNLMCLTKQAKSHCFWLNSDFYILFLLLLQVQSANIQCKIYSLKTRYAI